ncbi:shikimate dehydrogenase [Nesterenkonia populi]|uniref:shikimate dehydrogenase n=1 Tax=Nesterenkonia populi TaxID=1591087 RepID=UPI001FE7BAF0|nr:shikimate dehydrogenase [Nesterenkonia populi]
MSTAYLGRSILAGLIGYGVGPSMTPPLHEREGSRHGFRYVYRTIELPPSKDAPRRLKHLLDLCRELRFDGLNITFPAKQTVLPLLDELAPTAQLVGAVNTVIFREDGTSLGHNTDVTGFRASLDDSLADRPCGRTVLLGAGGAGSAAAHALVSRGAETLTIVDVDRAKVEDLVSGLKRAHGFSAAAAAPDDLPALLRSAEGIVNATPFGMAHHPGTPFDTSLVKAEQWVADVVYRPVRTELLLQADARGAFTISGLGMAMNQAAEAFEIFTGEPADRAAMLTDLHEMVAAEAAADRATTH